MKSNNNYDLNELIESAKGATLSQLNEVLDQLLKYVKTDLTKKERLFTAVAYTPKATVQAAIGAIPLSMGLACGNVVLTAAVVSILLTAPLGAICVDTSYKKLLSRDEKN